MTHSEKVKLVARVLKKQLTQWGNGVTNEQAVLAAYKIIEALEKSDKATNTGETS
jgi:hypothetical protein